MTSLPALSLRTVVLALVALSSASAWAQRTPVLGEPSTQRVDLVAGPNLVALSVYPEDARVEVLFGAILDDIVLVKDADGVVFAPEYGVYDLDRWQWDEAHLVYARSPVSLTVEGRQIEAASPIVLSEGWNWAPYFASETAPIAEALRTISETIARVEDVDGRVYPDDGTSPALETLAPGQGYRVHVARTDTLVYSGDLPAPAPPGDRFVVASIAEALALTGLVPGQVVEVAGYYEPGDGGGGTFDVVESGVAPDGGTVFVPDEHASGVIEETRSFDHRVDLSGLPDAEDVVFGTLDVRVANLDRARSLLIPGEHLHGHSYQSRRDLRPLFYYEGGVFLDANHDIKNRYLGQDNGSITFRYRHTTSDLRLHRLGVGQVLNTHWFGARPAAAGPNWTGSTDTQPLIAHTINVAAALNSVAAGTIRSVLLPALDRYDYFGSIEVTEGLMLSGAAGTALVTVTNDLGHTYQPVRIRPDHTRLRVMDGEALRHIRMDRKPSEPGYRSPDAKQIVAARPTLIALAGNVMEAGIEDLVLDGNWEGNFSAWSQGWATDDELKEYGQESPSYAAFVSTSHGGKQIPQGQHVVVRNVAVHGYASNGLLGNANNTWTVTNFRGGDALWNHVVYNANGTYENLTFTGFSWGHAAWGYGTITNLVYEDGSRSPVRQSQEVVGIRGGDAYDPDELAGRDGYFTRLDGTVPALATTVAGFYMDLRESGLGSAFNGIGPNVTLRGASAAEPGRIVEDDGSGGVFYESANGYQRAMYPNNRFEDIVLHTRGGGRRWTFNLASHTESLIRNVRTEPLGANAAVSDHSLSLRAGHRDHPSWDRRQTLTVEGLVETSPTHFLASVSAVEGTSGLTVRIRRSAFDNQTSTIYRYHGYRDGDAAESFLLSDPSKLEVFMDDVAFNIHDDHIRNTRLFFATTYFRNCTDMQSGRRSEDGGQFTSSGGGDVVDIPTNLLWRPMDPSFVDVRASVPGLVSSVDVVRSADGADDWRAPVLRVRLSRALGSGEQVTFDWSAAVRPFPASEL